MCDEDLVKRQETAIAFLDDGLSFTVGDFALGVGLDGKIFVNGYSAYIHRQISREKALEDLRVIKSNFLALMEQSLKFSKFAEAKGGIDYYLVVESGQAGIAICTEISGNIQTYI